MWTIVGPVPIDQVAPGDLVLAIHEHSGEVGFYPVSDLIVTDGAATNAVTLFHDTGDSETLDVTDVYPFWIESRGDARGPAPAGWAQADTLAPGDTVRTLAGLARVEAVAAEARRQRVHNLSVADARTFLVGDGGAWVHNCGAGKHHIVPQYLGGWKEHADKEHLNAAEHTDLHNMINAAGKKRGIPTKQAGTDAVERWAYNTNDAHVKIADALREAYAGFDRKYGTQLSQRLNAELKRQGW